MKIRIELRALKNAIKDITDLLYDNNNQDDLNKHKLLSGRTIKNIVKLSKKTCKKKNIPFSLEIFNIVHKHVTI